jgi:parallel beta-helix repeat protein
MKQQNMQFTQLRSAFFATSLAGLVFVLNVGFSSCKKALDAPETIQPSGVAERLQANAKKAPTIIVKAGTSIQSAVNAAATGSVIQIEPGTYREAIVVNKANITIVGSQNKNRPVIIQSPGDEDDGITVQDAGDGFVLKDVTVRDFEENGVVLSHVNGFLLSHVTVINNGEYGLFPVFSTNGVIEDCEASGHSDTGIYVGQSSDVSISNNEAHDNVNGIEIENCTNVTAEKNHSYHNVVGIMSVLLPDLVKKVSSNIVISKNVVEDNNHENFAHEGELESFVPSGSGILVVGSDNTLVSDNKVSGHQFVGIAVVSTLILAALNPTSTETFADIEPNPDGVKVIGNHLENNGYNPPQGLPLPGVDLLWDGSGSNNCWSKNHYSTSFPADLPACQ